MAPLISVIMPVRNAERFLLTALESILAQGFADFELLIVDDASQDTSAAIVKEIPDRRIVLLRNSEQRGVAVSLNRALAQARGTLIARMDADDVCHPDRFRQQVEYLETNPEVAVVGCACHVIDDEGRLLETIWWPQEPYLVGWEQYFSNQIAHPAVMMRRDLVLKAGGYSTNTPHVEDYDLWLRLGGGHQLANLGTPLVSLRRHSRQVSMEFAASQERSADLVRGAALGVLLGRPLAEGIARWWGMAARKDVLESKEVVRIVAQLVTEALAAYVRKWALPKDEAGVVRYRAARRLLALAYLHARDLRWTTVSMAAEAARLSPAAIIGRSPVSFGATRPT